MFLISSPFLKCSHDRGFSHVVIFHTVTALTLSMPVSMPTKTVMKNFEIIFQKLQNTNLSFWSILCWREHCAIPYHGCRFNLVSVKSICKYWTYLSHLPCNEVDIWSVAMPLHDSPKRGYNLDTIKILCWPNYSERGKEPKAVVHNLAKGHFLTS